MATNSFHIRPAPAGTPQNWRPKNIVKARSSFFLSKLALTLLVLSPIFSQANAPSPACLNAVTSVRPSLTTRVSEVQMPGGAERVVLKTDPKNGFVMIDYEDHGIKSEQMVTGENYFPSSFIGEALDVDFTALARKAVQGQATGPDLDFLLVAMSYTSALPILLEKGYSVRALDLWYGQGQYPPGRIGENMKMFFDRMEPHLIGASALHMPLASDSVANVLSFRLVSAQDAHFQSTFLKEAIRVLKPGGTLRIYGYDKQESEVTARLLRETYGADVSFKLEQRAIERDMDTSLMPDFDNLMQLTRVVPQPGDYHLRVKFNDLYLLKLTKFAASGTH